MKKRSVDSAAAAGLQKALKKTLDMFGGDSKDMLLFYLYKEHGVSIYDPGNLTRKKIELAFSALFGRGSDILMQKFNAEIGCA